MVLVSNEINKYSHRDVILFAKCIRIKRAMNQMLRNQFNSNLKFEKFFYADRTHATL